METLYQMEPRQEEDPESVALKERQKEELLEVGYGPEGEDIARHLVQLLADVNERCGPCQCSASPTVKEVLSGPASGLLLRRAGVPTVAPRALTLASSPPPPPLPPATAISSHGSGFAPLMYRRRAGSTGGGGLVAMSTAAEDT